MRFFVPLLKVEDGDDDTLIVSGIASTETPDRSGEIITAAAVRGALPDFFAHGTGALREMHGLSAAGTVDEAAINEDNQTLISTTVVDPVAIKKVKTGTYKGFSVGGRVLERDKKDRKIITKIALNEISLVDRPANPEAVFDLYKADGSINSEKADPMTDKSLDALSKAELEAIIAKPDPGEAGAAIAAHAAERLAKMAQEAAGGVAASAASTPPEGDVAAKTDGAEPVTEAAAPETEAPAPLSKAEEAIAKMESLGAIVGAGDLAKGLYSVSQFAEILQGISYLVQSGQYEAESEGDNSPVPAALRDWLKDGAKIFISMAKEEIDELVASVSVKKAEEAEALAKADSDRAEALAAITAEKDALAKAVADKDELLNKIGERLDPLAKAYESVVERLAALEAQPLPPKTGGPLAKTDATPVNKEQDVTGQNALTAAAVPSQDDLKKALAAMTEDERTMLLTKVALSQPRPVINR